MGCDFCKAKNGIYSSFDQEGYKFDVPFINDIKEGTARIYDGDILIKEIEYKNNKRNGRTRTYHENGAIMEDTYYVDDIKHGISRNFLDDGREMGTISYDMGVRIVS